MGDKARRRCRARSRSPARARIHRSGQAHRRDRTSAEGVARSWLLGGELDDTVEVQSGERGAPEPLCAFCGAKLNTTSHAWLDREGVIERDKTRRVHTHTVDEPPAADRE